jgi:uncharacterized coiled-coil DUF342 family protein
METDSPQTGHVSDSASRETNDDVRERAATLREKVVELSKTFDQIEETLAEAADGKKDPND